MPLLRSIGGVLWGSQARAGSNQKSGVWGSPTEGYLRGAQGKQVQGGGGTVDHRAVVKLLPGTSICLRLCAAT